MKKVFTTPKVIGKFMCGLMMICMTMSFISCNKKSPFDIEYLAVKFESGQNWSIIDADGKVIANEEYSPDCEISVITDGVYWVKDKNGFQLYSIDNPKKPLTEDVYDNATTFVEGRSYVVKKGEPIKLINTEGEVIKELPATVTFACRPSDNGYSPYFDMSNMKSGLLDKDGDAAIEPSFLYIQSENEGYCFAANEYDKEVFFIDTKGNKKNSLSTEKYNFIYPYVSNGMIATISPTDEDRKVSYINVDGEKLFTINNSRYYDQERFPINTGMKIYPYIMWNGYAVFNNSDYKYGVVDSEGELVIRPKYTALMSFKDNTFIARKTDKWGIVDNEDNTVLDFDYDKIVGLVLGGNYIVKQDETYLVVNKSGKKEITDEFEDISCEFFNISITTVVSSQLANIITKDLTPTSYRTLKGNEPLSKAKSVFLSPTVTELEEGATVSEFNFITGPTRIATLLQYANPTNDQIKQITVRVLCGPDFNDVDGFYNNLMECIKAKGFSLQTEDDYTAYFLPKNNTQNAISVSLKKDYNNIIMAVDYENNSSETAAATKKNTDTEETEIQPDEPQTTSSSTPDYSWLSKRAATSADIAGKSSAELRIMRNYIFARHGYIFKSNDLKTYFSQFSWYKPTNKDVTSLLNPIEKKNVAFIKSHE